MLPLKSTPRCKQCDLEMLKILRIEPVGHEPGMTIYECPQCKTTVTIFLDRDQDQKLLQ
jgi:hypothetical protein